MVLWSNYHDNHSVRHCKIIFFLSFQDKLNIHKTDSSVLLMICLDSDPIIYLVFFFTEKFGDVRCCLW